MAVFRLGGLLRLRRLQEDQAAAELARANAQRRSAQERREETEDMLAGNRLPHRGDLLSFQAAVASRAATTGLVGESILALQATVARADRATDAWSDARTRAVTLSKLEDRHDAAVQVEELRLEQLVLDESATRRHLSGQDDRLTSTGAAPRMPADPTVTAAPVTTAAVTDAPVTDAPVTDAPVTDAPVTDAPVTDAPTEENR